MITTHDLGAKVARTIESIMIERIARSKQFVFEVGFIAVSA